MLKALTDTFTHSTDTRSYLILFMRKAESSTLQVDIFGIVQFITNNAHPNCLNS